MRNRLTRFLWTVLAAIFLVEAWLWDVLGGALSALVAVLPIEATRRALRRLIDSMPAAFALSLFLLPVLIILPFKLAGLALIASGRVVLGGGVFLLAKSASVGVTAFIYDVCHERLMTLRWFVRAHDAVIRFRDWARTQVEPYRVALKASVAGLRAQIASRLATSAPGLMSRVAAFRARVRERMRA